MIKRAGVLAVAVFLALTILGPVPVQAQGGLKILSSSAKVEFPSELSFSLSTESDVDIADIRLHYTVDRISLAHVTSEVYIEFVPGPVVDTEWTLDMRMTGGLPPGSSVEYWWTVEDASGCRVETAPARVQFDDNRYFWHSLTEGKVTIFWYEGGDSFAQELMAAAHQALARLTEDTGACLERPVSMYIYASTSDLQGAMIYSQEWAGGVTFARYGIIAIGISPDSLYWGKRTVVHELTHLIIHQEILNPYCSLPTWLDEGLAMYAEGNLEPGFATALHEALAEDSLISVRSLSSPFSAFAEESYLAYAQGYSLVEFLVTNYGQAKMLELLDTFSQGSSYDAALGKVYGFDTDGLDALWRDYVTEQYGASAVTTTGTTTVAIHPALFAVLAALATGLLLVLGLFVEDWAWRRGW